MRLSAWIVVVVVLAAGARAAAAYPRFQLSTGATTCTECHLAPGGGGLLTEYGRLEAGDTISRGGDGALLHGAWTPPDWLALGADLRGAVIGKQQDGERELLAFPMQADVHARAGTAGLSFTLIAGLRGGARDPQPPLVERLWSREHYVTYERDDWYARAGRFYPVVGLRLPDHTAFVRRYLGQGLYEEPYGLAAGTVRGEWEAHAHVYVPRPITVIGAGRLDRGAALSYERRILELTAAIGASVRYARSDDDTRATAGVTGKRWFEGSRLLLLGQLDVQRQAFANGAGRWQLASYLGATQTVARGVLVGVALHRWQPDLTLATARDAVEVDVQYFPRAHWELHVVGRATAAGNDLDAPALLSMLQLHYYP